MRRWLGIVAAIAVGFVLVAVPAALAEFRGSDLPESQVTGGLVDRYPLSAYALDYHVDVGVTNPDGVPPMIAQWAAAQLWSATSFLVKTVIDVFTWAFSLDLLGGGDGALAPVAEAISSLYENVIGQAWMVAAIVVAGLWGIWKALVQRRYTETAAALALSLVFVLVALFFVYQPERTIGEASRWTNRLSLAFLSGANRGSLDDPGQAKRQVADHLFQTLVYEPWVVLEFGGLSHCVDTRHPDGDGYPKPVGPHDASANVCRDHLKPGRDGHGGYARRYLGQAAGSKERTAEYDALRKGEAPADPQFAGYRVDKSDSPAVDVQQAGGAYQRLTFSVVVFLGALGAVALLGFLSLAVILAQVVALVLLGFAPVALVIAIFPGAGHEFFRGWLAKLATAIFIKALYSLVIAIVVAVSAALTAATGSLGFLFAFGLQTLFFWAIFVYRKQITARVVAATTGSAAPTAPQIPRMTVVQRGAHMAARPFTTLVGVTRRDNTDDDRSKQQESALEGGSETSSSTRARTRSTAPRTSDGHGPGRGGANQESPGVARAPRDSAPANTGGSHGTGSPRHVTLSEPPHVGTAAAGRDASTPAPAPRGPNRGEVVSAPPPSAARERATPAPDHRPAPATEATPRATHEHVMRRARELREHEGALGLGDGKPRG